MDAKDHRSRSSRSSPANQRGRARLLVVGLTALALAVLGVGPAQSDQPSDQPDRQARSATQDDADSIDAPTRAPEAVRSASGTTHLVTLLTGDVVALHIAPDGRQTAWLERPAEQDDATGLDGTEIGQLEPRIFEQDGQVYVVPAEAEPYLAADLLDLRLFDITYLAEHGYADDDNDALPLLLTAPDGPATRSLPTTPAGATAVRELPSIGGRSIAATKDRVRRTWEDLRGPEVATLEDMNTAEVTLAGAGKIWLNAKVEATLDESVAHVGAPDAWGAGLDGTGVSVAVLDSGYDPDHPDLADRVSGAADFTTGDPAVTSDASTATDTDTDEPVGVDGHGHGTHVAATVAGTGAATDGERAGVAPGADLLVGKVLDDDGSGYIDWIIAGMEWAVDEGADVVNLSLGTPGASDGTDPMSLAVDELTERSDTLFVVSAGNSGPGSRTVTAPGAATRALTVGATTKDGKDAWFSSRGPRPGDDLLKPELVAPGVDIVAARAGGTALGNLIDEHYTSMNGTSMAAPHVAGAAAILAQQHPDAGADELKARLTSTSRPMPDQPVRFAGAGRLDVSAAVEESFAVSSGTLSFGRIDVGETEPVRQTLTYHNPGDRPIVLRLSTELDGPQGTGAGDDQGRDGRGGRLPTLRVDRATLPVPAGGTATATVEVRPGGRAGGAYTGRITAVDLRDRTTHLATTVTFGVDTPPQTVRVTAVGRDGEPVTGFSVVDVWNPTMDSHQRAFFQDGTVTLELTEGTYTLLTAIEDDDNGTITVAAEPDFVIEPVGDGVDDAARDRALELHYDVRDAEAVRVDTPRDAGLVSFDVSWKRELGDSSAMSRIAHGQPGFELFLLAGPEVVDGDFTLSTIWHLDEPWLRFELPDGNHLAPSSWLSQSNDPYVGAERLAMVDAGRGTPEEFAAAGADGAIALVTRDPSRPFEEQVTAAEAAGAVFLLAYDPSGTRWREFPWGTTFSAYIIDAEDGARLRDAIAVAGSAGGAGGAGGGAATFDVVGIADPTYSYLLSFFEDGAVPAGAHYDVADHPLATVTSDYRQNSARMGRTERWVAYVDGAVLGNSMTSTRRGPVERTEYVSAEGQEWQRMGQPHGELPGVYWTWSAIEPYEAGAEHSQVWWGPLVAPAVPPRIGVAELGSPVARFVDAIRIDLPHYRYGSGSLNGEAWVSGGDDSELVLRRDGAVVGTAILPRAQFTVPAEDAAFELELLMRAGDRNFADTSVATESIWSFRSERTGQERTVLPLVQLEYDIDADAYNRMPADASYPLWIGADYQPEATGPGGFTLTVEVSFDDGDTWQEVPVDGGAVHAGDAEQYEAMVPVAPAGAEFASVRVTATDADGNRLAQRIDRAWRLAG